MDEIYKRIIKKTEAQREKDPKLRPRESPLLEVKDERTIPRLRVNFKFNKRRIKKNKRLT
jgi:hypothetical protein